MKPEDFSNPKNRAFIGKLSGAVGIICNAVLAVGKLIAGSISASVSVTADGLNNLSDAASSVVTLVGFKLAERPADKEHPYGHARFEYLAGLAVGYWKSKEDVIKNQSIDQIFSPQMSEEERQTKRKGWNKAVKYAYGWAKDEPEEEEE